MEKEKSRTNAAEMKFMTQSNRIKTSKNETMKLRKHSGAQN
jgi:hypothetical protein